MSRYIADDVAARVVDSHGFAKHIGEFNNPELGPVLNISTREDFESHIKESLKNGNGFIAFSTNQKWREADIFYHEPSNTLIANPVDPEMEPTAYRPKLGVAAFDDKLQEAERIEGREIPVVHGIDELNPELQKTPQPGPEPKQVAPFPSDSREGQYQELRDLFESYYGRDDQDYEPEAPSLEPAHEEDIER